MIMRIRDQEIMSVVYTSATNLIGLGAPRIAFTHTRRHTYVTNLITNDAAIQANKIAIRRKELSFYYFEWP